MSYGDDLNPATDTPETPPCLGGAQRLDEAIAEYLQAAEIGPPPDRDAFIQRYPDLAAGLIDFFDDHDRFARIAGVPRNAASGSGDGLTTPAPPITSPGSSRAPEAFGLPGYDTLGFLGRGGMGVVLRAVQLSTRRQVALKLMNAACFRSPRSRLRFDREVELTARLQHPNIARVYDSGRRQGVCFYAMELIEGGVPLDDYVRAHNLPARDVLALVRKVCDAVQHAHQRGVIHRDLKPANVLVDRDGEPKVLDFGLAKALGGTSPASAHDDLSLDGDVAGTPAYMSPEQAAGSADKPDTRTDVYSLGVILYRLLTGRSPHDLSGTRPEVLRRISNEEVTRPRRAAPALDRELEALLLKALAKEPDRRYASAGELSKDIGNYLAGEPILARAPTTAYFLGKRIRKYRTPLGVAALIVLLIGGVVVHGQVQAAARRKAFLDDLVAERQRTHEQRRQAEVALAESWVAQADALGLAGMWGEAKARYAEARLLLARLGAPTFAAELGVWNAYRHAPPALASFSMNPAPSRVELSPDGAYALLGFHDGSVRLIDTHTGTVLRALSGHKQTVTDLTFSPDGRLGVSAAGDNKAKVWELASGNLLREFPHVDGLSAVKFSTDGRFLLSVSMEWSGQPANPHPCLKLWDLTDGRLVHSYTAHDALPSYDAAFSADGGTAVCAGWPLLFWDVRSGRRLRASLAVGGETWDLETHEPCDPVGAASTRARPQYTFPWTCSNGVAVSPDGRSVLTGDGESAKLWEVKKSQDGESQYDLAVSLVHTFPAQGPVSYVAFSPDGRLAIAAGRDGTVRIWQTHGGTEVLRLTDHAGGVTAASLSADGRYLLAAGDGVKLWDLRGGDGSRKLRDGPGTAPGTHPVADTAFCLDGRCVLSTAEEGTLSLWDTDTGRLVRTWKGHVDPAPYVNRANWATPDLRRTSTAVFPDGRRALTVSTDGVFEEWDLASGKRVRSFATGAEACGLAIAGDGRHAVTGPTDQSTGEQLGLRLWDLQSGREVARLPNTLYGPVREIAWSQDNRLAYCLFRQGYLQVWDVGGRREAHSHVRAGCFALSRDGTLLLAGSGDGPTSLADARTGERLRTVGNTFPSALCFSRDERFAAAGTHDGNLTFWDLAARRELLTLQAHSGAVRRMAFSPDGWRLLSVGDDGIRLWDFSAPARHRLLGPPAENAWRALRTDPEDPACLRALGEWYALRGVPGQAASLLKRARAAGADVPSLPLARCQWELGDFEGARHEFRLALARHEAPEDYLNLCIAAPTSRPATD